MRLYKILNVVGDHGTSVFPPVDVEVPEDPELAGFSWRQPVLDLQMKGYLGRDALRMAWAFYAHSRWHLHQSVAASQAFAEQCVAQIESMPPPAHPVAWGTVIATAIVVAVVLGLYAWAVLDQEFNVRFGTHEWAYLMSYEERMWQGEILNVGFRQRGYYERGGEFGGIIESVDRNRGGIRRNDWIAIKPGWLVLGGRRLVFYHEYRIAGFFVYFCGVMTNIGSGLYKLKEGGFDPYKPRGPWSRPGGRWGTPDYEGAWQEFWWL